MTKGINEVHGLKTVIRSWEVQPAPYTKPLPFMSTIDTQSQYPNGKPGQQYNCTIMGSVKSLTGADQNARTIATNAARAKLVYNLHEGASAALGITIVEWKSSLKMIAGALTSLASKRARAKLYYKRKASDIYLEGVFGWLPMINDIASAWDVLKTTPPTNVIKGSGNAPSAMSYIDMDTAKASLSCEAGCRAAARFTLVNQNVALLNQLGLLNPASVAWDAVPYSFVLNWFLPVGQMLNSLTDFVGYDVSDAYFTTKTTKRADGSVYERIPDTSKYTWYGRYGQRVQVLRKLGLPPYKLPSPALPTISLTKALIAFSLFDQVRDPIPKAFGHK